MQQRDAHPGEQLAGAHRVEAGEQVTDRHLAAGAGPGEGDGGLQRGEHRQGVAGRRGGDDVAAEGADVADLRRAGGAGGVGERGDERGEVGAVHPGVGESGAEYGGAAVLVAPAAQFGDPAEADQGGGAQPSGVDGFHQVGGSGHRYRGRGGGQRVDGLVERGRQHDRPVHLGPTVLHLLIDRLPPAGPRPCRPASAARPGP